MHTQTVTGKPPSGAIQKMPNTFIIFYFNSNSESDDDDSDCLH